jgi:hypothetical protein
MGAQGVQRQPERLDQCDQIAAEAREREAPLPLRACDQGRNTRQMFKWSYTQSWPPPPRGHT